MIAEVRREEIRALLTEAGAVTVSELQARFGISSMTARRDLDVLQRCGSARRTHGGAVLPTPLEQARSVAVGAETEQRLAEAAFGLLRAGETIFLDSSPVACLLALRIADGGVGVRVLTNGGSAIQALLACEDARVQLYAIGGLERRRTGSFVGPSSVRTIRDHFVDRCFLSVAGIARGQVLTDDDGLEAEVKRAMIEQARESVLMLDRTALRTHGRHSIAPLCQMTLVLADGVGDQDIELLHAEGVEIRFLDAARSH